MTKASINHRLPPPAGRIVDRNKSLEFTFEQRRYQGFVGDTIASALAANGVTTISRSFKYHRPRGIMSLAASEANTLVEVNGIPNVYAEKHILEDGDCVRGQNYIGSLIFDWGAWIGPFGRFLTVGFYYRAFFRPKGAWRFWEPIIRRIAGLGRADITAPHGYYDKAYLFCELAVVGGGPAGLCAAIAAAEQGREVIIIDDNPTLGGALNFARFDAAGLRANQEHKTLVSRVAALQNVTVLTAASCEGLFADNWLSIVQGNRLYKLRTSRVVIATGALEQPIVFRNNDLPGIMYGSAAQRLIKLYGVRPGERAVVLTTNDDGYGVALDLNDANVDIAAIVDLRSNPDEGIFRSAAISQNIKISPAIATIEAIGRTHVRGLRIVPAGRSVGSVIMDCDLVCTSGGMAPNLALAGHAGAQFVYDKQSGMHRPSSLPDGVTIAGSSNQRFSLDDVLADGARAGTSTTENLNLAARAVGREVNHSWPIYSHPRGKEFVDFDEDLTIDDIDDTVASGFADIQLLKRYSTSGMGPSQGRHSAINTIHLAARARGMDESEIGTTTARPPYSGESFGVLAGRSFDPVRRTAMHRRHLDLGAQMMPAGAWMRPAYYGVKENSAELIAREVAAVRSNAGLIDVSTLGKIEVRGPDAAEFLNRMYFTGHLKQPVGRARYAVMTDATGAISDDGVICRLADTHFFVTATTSGVEAVVRSMYYWNAQWQLDIDIAHVTSAYAAVNFAGPVSRTILAGLCRDVDFGIEAFPYMSVRNGHIADVPARILRVGFVGEVGYEIHVSSSYGEYLWDRLIEAGANFGLKPFGVEAQRVLRLEKGHIIISQDTDGLTSPLEIGMGFKGSTKPFFIGGAALAAHRKRGVRRKLVGFEIDGQGPVPKECHLVIENGEIAGRVTSCVHSAAVGRIIGLAYVLPHQAELGQTITIRLDDDELVTARIAPMPFYDPRNERQQA